MTPVLVDSNVLLDIFGENDAWFDWSKAALAAVVTTAPALINPIIYAEISMRFSRIEDLEHRLSLTPIRREAVPFEAAFLAGKVFLNYRRRGGRRVSVLPDFFIGAHAAINGYRLLTRDVRRYRTYFPTLQIVAPD